MRETAKTIDAEERSPLTEEMIIQMPDSGKTMEMPAQVTPEQLRELKLTMTRAELTVALANALDVSPLALTVPDIDSDLGLMHTLFALEETCGLRVEAADGEICLVVDASRGPRSASLREMLRAWREQAAKLEAGEITREEYDRWRYRYPEFDTTGAWHKISPSQELGDTIVKRGRKRMKRIMKEHWRPAKREQDFGQGGG